jgi:hypothetical protein
MLEVVLVSVQLALGIAYPWWAIRRDLRRLPSVELARAWLDTTVVLAVVAFGPVAVLVHFARTRRSLLGFALGLVWAAPPVLVSFGLGWLA